MHCCCYNIFSAFTLSVLLVCTAHGSDARDLKQILESGELRHLGVPYANFVTGSGDGLDVELMQGFAAHMGVQYRFVKTTWGNALGDLTGRHARRGGADAELLDAAPIRGDVIANGMTILPWRQALISFSSPTFPSAVWLVARADSRLSPITPSGSLTDDIDSVKAALADHTLLVLRDCRNLA